LALAEFSYNNSAHESTGKAPFQLLYGYLPQLDVEDDDPKRGAASASERIELLRTERKELAERLRKAAETHKKYYDRKHTPKRFNVKDKVMLAARNIKQLRPNKKLADKFLGPFEVLEIIGGHSQAYRLKLPSQYGRIHDVFHVSLLEPWFPRSGAVVEPLPERVGDHLEWEVKSIQAHKETSKGRRYLVRWKGYSPEDDTWEPLSHLKNATELLQEYHSTAPEAMVPRKARRQRRGK